jgi:hypothetical protein
MTDSDRPVSPEPCREEEAYAAGRLAGFEEGLDTSDLDLGAAWREVEEVLPEGWRLAVQRTDEDFDVWAATAVSPAFFDGENDDDYRDGQAATPTAALLALAERLRA